MKIGVRLQGLGSGGSRVRSAFERLRDRVRARFDAQTPFRGLINREATVARPDSRPSETPEILLKNAVD